MSKCCVCGCYAGVEAKKPRSVEQIRRYFALVRRAYHHWPEQHERQFASEEEFRKWVQVRAGACEVGGSVPLTGVSRARALMLAEATIRAAGQYAIPVIQGDNLVVWRPISIRFATMRHGEFTDLVRRVEEVIEAETGLRVDDLMREGEAA